jgi:endonuclease/exonuclease/phosphatase family metal-dependent hydrolase
MKIITLNTWGGRIQKELMDFLHRHQDVDVFCFQEVLKGGDGKTVREEIKSEYEDIESALMNHTGYFSEYGDGGYYSESSKNLDFHFGVACFAKKEHKQSFVDAAALYDPEKKWGDYDGRFAAGASLAVVVSDYVIVNVHGLWQGSMKKDSEVRFEQSSRIINLANKAKGKKIICGDFNLEPQTESIRMIENLPAKNLIKEFGVTSTRTSLYTKDVKFADYIFVSDDVNILDFKVLTDEVSDHSPLYVEL